MERNHDPDLRELTAQLDALRDLLDTKVTSLYELINERDRRYRAQFRAVEQAFKAALQAQKELTSAAFVASERAISKQEAAQTDYNLRSNEFRGQLRDQNDSLRNQLKEQADVQMPRLEAESRLKQLNEATDRVREEARSAGDGIKAETRALIEGLRTEVQGLRESRSESTGRGRGLEAGWGYFIAAAGLLGTLVGIAASILVMLRGKL